MCVSLVRCFKTFVVRKKYLKITKMPPIENLLVLACCLMKMKCGMAHRESGFAEVQVFPVSSSQAGRAECAPCTPVQPCKKQMKHRYI